MACKDTEMPTIIDALDQDARDALMKYLYKGLGVADNSGQLLKWHAQLTSKAGLGCIVRALTDRKTVLETPT